METHGNTPGFHHTSAVTSPQFSAHPLVCPVCGGGLHEDGRTLACPTGHTFDIARQGYVNLLVGRGAGVTGDSRDMLRARRAFLDGGFYAPLSDLLNEVALAHLQPLSLPSTVLDLGCGEGYYVRRLAAFLREQGSGERIACLGMDVSKDAVRMAASAMRTVRFFVADVRQRILVADGSISLLLNVFAPRNAAEFGRVVAPGGRLVVAIPGSTHLAGLRDRLGLLGVEEGKEQHVTELLAPEFRLARKHELAYEVELSEQEMLHLLRMTPNYWHRVRQGWQEEDSLGGTVVPHFVILEFAR